MSGSFRTQLPTMQAASQHVYQVNEEIQGQLASLLSRLEPLASTWQGEAAMSFSQLKLRWNDNATKLNQALRGIGDAIVANTRNYQSSDDQNREGFTGISSVLG
ncbi:MAG: WXG100 family type VII secretion target [Actinomycetota bacterium]